MAKDIEVGFPGGLRVEASAGGFTIATDQSVTNGGEGSAPEPFTLFLASLAACAGYYALQFCRTRDLPVAGLRLEQSAEFSEPGHVLRRVRLRLHLPEGFPERYREAIVRSAGNCAVKKAIAAAPEIAVEAVVGVGV